MTTSYLCPPPAGAPEPPLYDLSALGRLADNPAFVREIKQLFVQDTPPRLAGLARAIAAADWALVAREAHSIKSMMGTLGLPLPLRLLREMEQAAETAHGQLYLPTCLRALEAALEPVLHHLRHELGPAE